MIRIGCMLANLYVPQGRITESQLLELVVEDVGRCGSPGGFPVEMTSHLRSEGDAGNIQAEASSTEALRQDYARNSEQISVAGVEGVKWRGDEDKGREVTGPQRG